jgi:hypothetical protein
MIACALRAVFAPGKPVPPRIRLFVDYMLQMMKQFTMDDLNKEGLDAKAAEPEFPPIAK